MNDDPHGGQSAYELPPEELIREFMAAFHKLWELQRRIAGPVKRIEGGTPCDPYTPVPCPGAGGGGGLPALCDAINAWAECWKAWGDEVHAAVFPSQDNPPPPPPPPFV